MKPQAIILAGGLGTRLSSTVPGLPKCMAPVAGRPFLFYVINYLRSQGINEFIFSLGYKHEIIEDYLQDNFTGLEYTCTIEKEPLGTGGAIRLACQHANTEQVLIANGDTVFKIEVDKFLKTHHDSMSACTLALKPMKEFERYGAVELNSDNSIKRFSEKRYVESGLINGGLYLLNRSQFLSLEFPGKFSFEKDYLESTTEKLMGYVDDGYFIDIGIPEDYQKAQEDFATPALDLAAITKSWTLFIDRDGVINYEKKEDYIRNWEEFKFYENVPGMFKKLSEKFGRIIVVSNQRGVGKELMTEGDLGSIHDNMIGEIRQAGGHIDGIYYCTSIYDTHPDRKPNPGMAKKAKKDFPEINFSRSVMVGNTLSDMRFARNAGIYSVFIATTRPDTPHPHPDIDLRFDTLKDFVKAL